MSFATKEQLKELAAYMASQINVPTIGIGGGYAPIGTIIQYMGVTAPQDYLICDGTVYNIANYPQLADFFEAQFGSKNYFGGNGSTTFAVPDLQGEFLRGTGTNSHTNQGSGAAVGTHQDGTEIPIDGANENAGLIYGSAKSYGFYVQNADHTENVLGRSIPSTRDIAGAGVLATIRPTNTSVLYCIKAVVAGDVYSTEERVVGTWIDGKKIYQKTINFGTLPNNTTKNVAHGISNLKRVIHISTTWMQSGEIYSGSLETMGGDSNNGVDIFVDAINLSMITSTDRTNRSVYITLQYTKTTD